MKRIFILVYAAAAFFITSCKNEEHKEEMETKFKVTSPMQKDTLFFHEYVAQIHSISHIELRSQEKGYLQNIYADEGQSVKKGQLMFRIMPQLYEAELSKAQAEANFAEREYLNTKSLADSHIVSKNELSLAKAHYDKAKAELSLAKTHLDFTEIRAPFDGIMGRFNVRLGSLVEEGELLTTLSDNSKMWVYFNIPEVEYLNYITKAKPDKPLEVKLEMANKELFDHNGIVETIQAEFNNETGNIAFRATFPNPQGILRHGETGNVLMPVFIKDALIIPQKATFEILDKKYVFVVDESGKVNSREITVGAELPHFYVVAKGLTVKDKILFEGLRKVKNGQQIHYEFVSFPKISEELNQLHAE